MCANVDTGCTTCAEFADRKVARMRLEKDLAKMSSFVSNLITAIAIQGKDYVFNTCVPNII